MDGGGQLMITTIRPYRESDWPTIEGWWIASGETPPLPTMMPLESSFVAEIDGKPALAVTVYLTNTPEVAYTENFIGNPKLRGSERTSAAVILSNHIAEFAKAKGFKRLLCMTEKWALRARYQQLGYEPTLSGVTTFVRSL
jgi:hypothetical protein